MLKLSRTVVQRAFVCLHVCVQENQERAKKIREEQRERELQFKRQQRERANQGAQPFFLKKCKLSDLPSSNAAVASPFELKTRS